MHAVERDVDVRCMFVSSIKPPLTSPHHMCFRCHFPPIHKRCTHVVSRPCIFSSDLEQLVIRRHHSLSAASLISHSPAAMMATPAGSLPCSAVVCDPAAGSKWVEVKIGDRVGDIHRLMLYLPQGNHLYHAAPCAGDGPPPGGGGGRGGDELRPAGSPTLGDGHMISPSTNDEDDEDPPLPPPAQPPAKRRRDFECHNNLYI